MMGILFAAAVLLAVALGFWLGERRGRKHLRRAGECAEQLDPDRLLPLLEETRELAQAMVDGDLERVKELKRGSQ